MTELLRLCAVEPAAIVTGSVNTIVVSIEPALAINVEIVATIEFEIFFAVKVFSVAVRAPVAFAYNPFIIVVEVAIEGFVALRLIGPWINRAAPSIGLIS